VLECAGVMLSPADSARTFRRAAAVRAGLLGCGLVVLNRLAAAIAEWRTPSLADSRRRGAHDAGGRAHRPNGLSRSVCSKKRCAPRGVEPISSIYRGHARDTHLGYPIELNAPTAVSAIPAVNREDRLGEDQHRSPEAAQALRGLIKFFAFHAHAHVAAALHYQQPNPIRLGAHRAGVNRDA